MVIRLSERESLFKGFLLFFIVIEIFLSFIFYNYYKIEVEHTQERISLEMKNYSFFLNSNDKKFDIDIVKTTDKRKMFELEIDDTYLYIYTPISINSSEVLRVNYPRVMYEKSLESLRDRIYLQFILISIIALVISLSFSFYLLKPMRDAIYLLEIFIKDIIHDLNTPVTSILINLKMIPDASDEVDSIEKSLKTISMLHKNLNNYIDNMSFEKNEFNLVDILEEQISFFASMYTELEWSFELDDEIWVYSDESAVSRILYNIINNACRYNKTRGFIKIYSKDRKLCIINDSYGGIKNPNRVFERFYKEGERGIGIGLHIVEKLCLELDIDKSLEVDNNIVKFCLDLDKLTI